MVKTSFYLCQLHIYYSTEQGKSQDVENSLFPRLDWSAMVRNNKYMFEQLKDAKRLMDMQNAIKREEVTAQKNGVTITINGAFELKEIKLNPELSINDQERAIKDCYLQATRDLQMKLMSKMQGMGM